MTKEVREVLFRAITNQIRYAVKRGDTEQQAVGQAMTEHMDEKNFTKSFNNEIGEFIQSEYARFVALAEKERAERDERDDLFFKAMIESLVSRDDKGDKFIADLTKAKKAKEKKEKKDEIL